MPKTKRDIIKRTMGQAGVNLNFTGQYLNEIAEQFREAHPELAEGLDLACQGLVEVENIMKVFCQMAWYVDNPVWSTWAGTNRPRSGDLYPLDEEQDEPTEAEYNKDEGLTAGDHSPSE